MDRKIINCISTIKELDVEKLNLAGCGVEIQDFVGPNLTEEDIGILVDKYTSNLAGIKGIKSMHGPFLDLKPVSPDREIRLVSQLKYKKALEIANKLDLDYVVFHSQINTYLNEPSLRDINNKQAANFWNSFIEITPYKGKIVIENVFEESPYMLRELIDSINHSRIAINLDIGHLNLGNCSLWEWIDVLGDKIEYMHIHSNNGLQDQHYKPSEKVLLNLFEVIEKKEINPILALEYKVMDIEKEVKRYN